MKRAALVFLVLLTLCGCAPKEEPCVGICYQITGGKNAMTLLGSIHIGNREMTEYGPGITQAMAAADTFVFECDNESADARQAAAALRQAETPLKETIGTETYQKLEDVAKRRGYAMERFDSLRPWAAASLLATDVAATELGVRNAKDALALGVEETVRKSVSNRRVLYLETAREQLQTLDDFSLALQETLLESACDEILKGEPTGLADWPQWWREGNAAAFAKAYAKENQLAEKALTREYHQALVTDRNRRMAAKLQEMLEDDEGHSYFVTVGLLHLVLPGDSIVEELTSLGYTVTQLVK